MACLRFCLIIALVLLACKAKRLEIFEPGMELRQSYIGYGVDGKAADCYQDFAEEKCELGEEHAKFLQDCEARGGILQRCNCEQFLCTVNVKSSGKLLKGFDLKGKARSCVPADKMVFCTMEVTPSDEFANRCREKGHGVIRCGCHDYLCEVNIGGNAAEANAQ